MQGRTGALPSLDMCGQGINAETGTCTSSDAVNPYVYNWLDPFHHKRLT